MGLLGAIFAPTLANGQKAGSNPRRGVARIAKPIHFRLENGLNVVLQPDRRQPRTVVLVSYAIGTRDDPEGYDGLAHLVEHMTFRGSRHLRSFQSFEELERVGAGIVNASTSLDRTDYYTEVPASELPLALWIESERMAFTLERLSDESLESERKIIENELKLSGAWPGFFDHVLVAAFGERHPYGRLSKPLSALPAIDLESTRWFFQQGYRPSNASLVVVGDFEPERARELVERYFAPIRNPAVPFGRLSAEKLVRPDARRLDYRRDVYRESVLMLWAAPAPGTRERAALSLASYAIVDAAVQAVVESRLVSSGGSVDFEDLELGSVFIASLGLIKGHRHDEAIERILAEFSRVSFEAIRRSVTDTRSLVIVDTMNRLQSPLGRALGHVEELRRTGRPWELSRELQMLGSVKPEEVQAAFAECFLRGRRLDARLIDEEKFLAEPRVSITS